VRFRENFQPTVPGGYAPRRVSSYRFVGTAVVAILIAAIAPGYLAWGDRDAEAMTVAPIALPDLAGWNTAAPSPEYRPSLGRSHADMAAGYAGGDGQVDVFVGYYARQSTSRKLPRTLVGLANEDHWRRASRGTARIEIGGEPVTLATERLIGRGTERIVWAVYWVNGRFTSSPLQVKIEQLKSELLGGRRDAAVIVMSAEATPNVRQAEQILSKFGSNLGALRAALAGMGTATAARN
jgi:EpsI family protein